MITAATARVWEAVKATFTDWLNDNAPLYGAAIAFYSIFSLAPLLIIVIGVAGLAFGREAVQGQILEQFGGLLGKDGATFVQEVVENASREESGILATVVGIVTLLLGATAVFNQLKVALNVIWKVHPTGGGGYIKTILVDRFLSFAMVQCIAFLLLVSLVISAALAALSKFLEGSVPGLGFLLELGNFVISFAVMTLLFATIYKLLPDARIAWSDVWIGSIATAVLFGIGKSLIGLYLGRSGVGSVYGAAGSAIVLLLWIYYSAQVFLLGAEFTRVYSCRWGSKIVSSSHAAWFGRGRPRSTPEAAPPG